MLTRLLATLILEKVVAKRETSWNWKVSFIMA